MVAVLKPKPETARRRVTVLGATGSIGRNTVDMLKRRGGGAAYDVVALTGHGNAALLAEQARDLGARRAVIGDPTQYDALKTALTGSGIEAAAGYEAIIEAAEEPTDWCMAAIIGAAGLRPALAAAAQGAVVALATKECLVAAGPLFLETVRNSGATLLPVDSEHNAIFQVFETERADAVERLILTASGGPFRDASLDEMRKVTPKQAVAHPNWSMGVGISLDSATMFNKGLEYIEAARLFPVAPEQIEILIHRQSIIHSMVGYADGSVLAQLGAPDMRTPIAYALGWPERIEAPVERLDFPALARLDFAAPDEARFPALRLAREVLQAEGAAPCVLNAAKEVASDAFLRQKTGFLDIAAIVEDTLVACAGLPAPETLADVLAVDAEARRIASDCASRRTGKD